MFPFPFSFLSGVAPDVPVERIANAEAMSFNGTDAYIDTGATPSSLNLPYNTVTDSDFSISFWYYFNANQSNDPIIQATQYATNGFGVWQSSTNTASLNFWVGHYSSGSLNTTQLTSGTWYHIACVFEGGATHTQSIYVNGVLNNSVSYTTSRVIHSGKNCLIGGQAFQVRYFEVKLDEFAIFNTALSANKIQQIHDATAVVDGEVKTANLFTGGLDSSLVYWNRMGDS